MTRVRALVLALALLCPMRAAAWWWSGADVECGPKDRPISIDGKDTEWRDVDAEDVDALSLACFSDATDLYLYVSPHDRPTELQLLGDFGQTFTLWFDADRSKKTEKSVGLRAVLKTRDIHGQAAALLKSGPDLVSFDDPIDRLELVTASTAAPAPAGVEAKAGLAGQRLFYEFKVPLSAVGLDKGLKQRTFRLGLATSAFSQEAAAELGRIGPGRRGKGRGAGSEGGENAEAGDSPPPQIIGGPSAAGGGGEVGFGGGGIRRRGRRMRQAGPRGPVLPVPFELWPTVQLAKT